MAFKSRLMMGVLGALTAALAGNPVVAASNDGTLYSFHTSSIGACPGLDWHVVLAPDNGLSGFVAWDKMQHMARLNGSLSPNRSFQMDAKEVGGASRTAVVKGTAAGDYIQASLEGSGTACDGKPLTIPRVVGGMSGGGG